MKRAAVVLVPTLRTFAFTLAIVTATTAQAEALFGPPPVARFAPDIPFCPQNFAIAQDASGLVYLGDNEGVLLFDGALYRAKAAGRNRVEVDGA